jgi:flagellar hook-basal body complex protein FliE
MVFRQWVAFFGKDRLQDAANNPGNGRHFGPSPAGGVRSIRCHELQWAQHEPIGAMDLKLKPFDFAQAVARAGLGVDGQPLAKKVSPSVGAPSFQQAMADALHVVSQAQNDAQSLQREVQMDNPTVSLEEAMIAMQKAQIGFQAALQVRNRLVAAYSEIMNMQV